MSAQCLSNLFGRHHEEFDMIVDLVARLLAEVLYAVDKLTRCTLSDQLGCERDV